MLPEIKCAAKWWADQLRKVPSYKTDVRPTESQRFIETVSLYERDRIDFSEEQINNFQKYLEEEIEKIVKDHWYPDNPYRGSYLRTVNVDYGPDRTLHTALIKAGITKTHSFILPLKTSMIISPNSVQVGEGYRQPFVEIYNFEGEKNA